MACGRHSLRAKTMQRLARDWKNSMVHIVEQVCDSDDEGMDEILLT